MTVFATAIEDAHDARVIQSRDDIGFSFEAPGQFGVGGHPPIQQLPRHATW
jgi:hypothetical protein